MAFISYISILIVKLTEAMHLIVFPLPFVMSSVFEVERTVTILLVIALVALVASSIRYVLFDKL